MTEYFLPFRINDKIIELGGGDNPQFRPNYDIRQLPNVDVITDFNSALPIPNEDCHGIYCRYCLEHLSWRRIKNFLSEIFRILKTNGIAVFMTANLLEQSKILVNNPKWDEKIISMIFGDQNFQDNQWDDNVHHSGFSPEYIGRLLRDIGFGNVKIIPIQTEVGPTDMIIEAYKSGKITKEVDAVIINDAEYKEIKCQSHQFNRSYFEGETYIGIGYQDFPCHYNTLDIILSKKPESVIDIGGARGYLIKKLNDKGIYSVNIDISEHCWHTRVTDNFVLHDLTKAPYPFKDKEFDLSISISTLEHIPEENIPIVIKEISRISKRGLHGITFEITPQDIDKTHITIKPKEWWIQKFKENAPDYPAEIVDKEELEKGPVHIPTQTDNLIKLNIGSFINMSHYNWVNIDILDLKQFAEQNGYIYQQLDVTKQSLPYQDNSADIIISSHFVEHLTREEGLKFLQECLRALKQGSIIRLTIPDTELITKKYLDNTISDYRHVNIGIEQSEDNANSLFELLLSGHKTIYDYESISKLLNKVGFTDVKRQNFNKSESKIIETQTIDMYPTLSIYVEAKKPMPKTDILSRYPIITAGNPVQIEKAKTKIEQIRSTTEVINNKKLRIALISTPFFTVPPKGYGGLEQIVWDLAEGLDKLGHEVTVFAPEGSNAPPHGHLVVTGPSCDTVGIDWFAEEKKRYDGYKDIIAHDKYDLAIDNTWFAFIYLMKINNPNIKIMHTHHSGYVWETPPPVSKPNLVSISKWMKSYTEQYFRQKGFNIQSEYVYNCVDLERYIFDPNIIKKNRLLYLGRFSMFKGAHIGIEVAKKANLPIDLLGGTFIDDINYLKEIESVCDGDKIVIYKDVPQEFKIRKLQEAKALLVPSRFQEPFGLVCIEGMACGLSIVAYRDGAIPEIVLDGKTGYICDNEDQMVEAIKNLDRINPFDCRKRAEEFSRQRMAIDYEKLCYRILKGGEW